MITKESEYFIERWIECEILISQAHTAMNLPIEDQAVWELELKNKWLEHESEDCLLGKHETWSKVRQFLWEYYVSDDGVRHQEELDGLEPWMSDEGDEDSE